MKAYLIYTEQYTDSGNAVELESLKYVFFTKQEAEENIKEFKANSHLFNELKNLKNKFTKDYRLNIKPIQKRIPKTKEEAALIASEDFEIYECNLKLEALLSEKLLEFIDNSDFPDNIKSLVIKDELPEYFYDDLEIKEIELIHKNIVLE